MINEPNSSMTHGSFVNLNKPNSSWTWVEFELIKYKWIELEFYDITCYKYKSSLKSFKTRWAELEYIKT